MKVTGIGGFIFKAKDPKALASWYKKNLGIDRNKWEQQAGPTAFAPMSEDSDYFGNKSQQFILNFRVDDLDGMLKKLRDNKVEVVKDVEVYEGMGRFASIEDPEGNRIELWEPSE
ncbi:MAG TPA: VOC family protein [Candidatus Saccharimonadales bacterium]|nr:VOC family protein [Candidatus Saccharimonadales bacterium]